MNNNITMTPDQAKIYVSKYVIPQCNKGNEAILRNIIFSLSSVEWIQAGLMIVKEHPELTQDFIDKHCVTK